VTTKCQTLNTESIGDHAPPPQARCGLAVHDMMMSPSRVVRDRSTRSHLQTMFSAIPSLSVYSNDKVKQKFRLRPPHVRFAKKSAMVAVPGGITLLGRIIICITVYQNANHWRSSRERQEQRFSWYPSALTLHIFITNINDFIQALCPPAYENSSVLITVHLTGCSLCLDFRKSYRVLSALPKPLTATTVASTLWTSS